MTLSKTALGTSSAYPHGARRRDVGVAQLRLLQGHGPFKEESSASVSRRHGEAWLLALAAGGDEPFDAIELSLTVIRIRTA